MLGCGGSCSLEGDLEQQRMFRKIVRPSRVVCAACVHSCRPCMKVVVRPICIVDDVKWVAVGRKLELASMTQPV